MLWRWQGVQVFQGQGRQRICLHSVLLPQRLPLGKAISSRQSSFMLSNCNCNHFVHAMCNNYLLHCFMNTVWLILNFHGLDGKFYFMFWLHFGQFLQATSSRRLPWCNCKIEFANYPVKSPRSNIVYIVAHSDVMLKEYEHCCWSINNTQLVMSPLTWSVYNDIRTQQPEDFPLCTLQYSLSCLKPHFQVQFLKWACMDNLKHCNWKNFNKCANHSQLIITSQTTQYCMDLFNDKHIHAAGSWWADMRLVR